MGPSNLLIPSAAAAKHGDNFDAWNSSATGHQKAENRVGSSAGWRKSRLMKLSHQLKNGATGGKQIPDLVGAGSENGDRANAPRPADMRAKYEATVADLLVSKERNITKLQNKVFGEPLEVAQDTIKNLKLNEEPVVSERRIFDGLTIYVNGSTAPLISDHKLKYLLAEHGANISIHLGRRQVTHVILGNSCSRAGGVRAGGGLAATKIQKEIKKRGGCGIRYIGVEWVLESLKAGIRLPEARFSNLSLTSKGQRSVYGTNFKVDSVVSKTAKDSFGS